MASNADAKFDALVAWLHTHDLRHAQAAAGGRELEEEPLDLPAGSNAWQKSIGKLAAMREEDPEKFFAIMNGEGAADEPLSKFRKPRLVCHAITFFYLLSWVAVQATLDSEARLERIKTRITIL